jgi:hypothetical protein
MVNLDQCLVRGRPVLSVCLHKCMGALSIMRAHNESLTMEDEARQFDNYQWTPEQEELIKKEEALMAQCRKNTVRVIYCRPNWLMEKLWPTKKE